MKDAITLAREAGMGGDAFGWLASNHAIEKFYALARADLKADLAATRDLAEGYAQERNELKAENAKLLDALDTAITVIEEYQAASIRQGFPSPEVKKLREARGEMK